MHPLFSSTYSNPLFSPVHLSISLLKPLAPSILPHYFYLMCFIIASSFMAFYSLFSYGLFLTSWHLLILQLGLYPFCLTVLIYSFSILFSSSAHFHLNFILFFCTVEQNSTVCMQLTTDQLMDTQAVSIS